MSVNNKNLTSNRRLRKIKNEHCGWFNTDRNVTKNKKKNSILTGRKLYKHQSAQKYIKDNVMACVPACRMMIYNSQKEWFGFAVDLTDMAPDCLGQVFFEQANGHHNVLPKMFKQLPMDARIKLIKHRYNLNPMKKINLYAEPDENYLTVSGDNSYELISTLTNMVNSHGGLINYMHETSYRRPDLVGAIEKTGSRYVVLPGQNELAKKGKICPHCGVVNLFCQADRPNKPLRSKNQCMPVHEVSDDTFEYEDCTWEEVDGKWINTIDVAWRCGLCMADLNYYPVNSFNLTTLDMFFDSTPYLIGGLLEQLRLVGATDFFHEADDNDRNAIITHDMNIVKRLLSKMWSGCVMVPTNVETTDLVSMTNAAPQLTVVRSIRANCNAINVVSELSMLTGLMRSLLGNDSQTIFGSLIMLKDTNTEYRDFSSMFVDCQSTTDDNYDCVGPAGLKLPLVELLNKANKLDGLYVIVPTTSGEFKNDVTKIEYNEHHCYWSCNQTNKTLRLDSHTYRALSSDVIKTATGYNYVLTLHAGQFMRLVLLTKSYTTNPSKLKWYEADSKLSVSIPLPVSTEIIDDKMHVGIAVKQFSLNKELFRALCIRNINGEMHYESLSQYAIAFNMRRYTTGKVILKQQNVDYAVIQAHVISCIYVMTLQSTRNKIMTNVMHRLSGYKLENLIAAALTKLNVPKIGKELNVQLNWLNNGSALLHRGKLASGMKYLHSAIDSKSKRRCNVYDSGVLTKVSTIKCPHGCNLTHFVVPDGCKCCGVQCEANICKRCGNTDTTVMHSNSLNILLSEAWMQVKKVFNEKKIKRNKSKHLKTESNPIISNHGNISGVTVTKSSLPTRLDKLIQEVLEGNTKSTGELEAAINEIDGEELVNSLVDALDITLVHMSQNHDGSIHNEEGCYINLPFIQPEVTTIICEAFEFIEVVELANSEVNACGYEAFKYVANKDIALDDFTALVDQQPPFTSDRLFYAAEAVGHNLVIVSRMNDNTLSFEVLKIVNSDRFGCIMYTSPSDGQSLGHFSPVNLKVKSRLQYYLCDPGVSARTRWEFLSNRKLETNLTFCELNGRTNLELEATMTLTTFSGSNNYIRDLTIVDISGCTYLTNSSNHNVNSNEYNFKLDLEPRLAPYIVGSNTNNLADIFREELTLPSGIPPDLTQLKRLHLIDQTLSIINCRRELLAGGEHLTYFSQKRVVVGSFLQIDLPHGYLKPLDELLIKSGQSIKTTSVVRKVSGTSVFVDELPTPTNLTIGLHKQSISSCVKFIANLCQSNSDGTFLHNLLLHADCINGYGGTGKSEHIIRQFDKNQLVVTSTSKAKDNLISRGLPSSHVKTLEKASGLKLSNFKTLVVDEANMLNYMDLNRLLHSGVVKIKLYYDQIQISKFDSISLTGHQNLCIITDYPLNVDKWTKTYRYGPTLCKFLEPLLPEIESAADHDTDVVIDNINALESDWLVKYVIDNNIEVILNPYTREVNIIREILASHGVEHGEVPLNVKVEKVHSFQSHEADRVLFLQWRESNKPMGLCRDKHYVISALTRAKLSIHLVSVGHASLVVDVITACSSIGGQSPQPVTLKEWLEFNAEHTTKVLNHKLNKDDLDFEYSEGSISIYKFGRKVGAFERHNSVWTATSNIPFVQQRLIDSLDEPPGSTSDSKVNNAKQFQLCNSDKVRALAWTTDMLANSGRFYLGGSLNGLCIKKGGGCPLMCGLEVLDNKIPIVHITTAWENVKCRTVTYDTENDNALKFVSWLDGNPTNTFLDKIIIPSDMELNMMLDRAFTLPSAAVELSMGKTKLSPKTSVDNAAWASSVAAKHGFSTDFRWRSSVRHNMLILERRLSNRLTGRCYSIMHYSGVRHFSQWSNDDVMADVFNMSLSTVQPIMRKKRLIGAVEFGMYLSPEEHISNKTEVGRELARLKFKQDLRIKDSVKMHMSLSNTTYNEYYKQLLDDKQELPIMKHNATGLSSPVGEVIDSYMLAKFGSVDITTKVSYMGLNSVLCGVTNKHYINLVEPKGEELKILWHASVKIYKSWFESFVNRMKDSLKEKAEHIKSISINLTSEQQQSKLEMLQRQKELATYKLTADSIYNGTDVVLVGSLGMYLTMHEVCSLTLNSKSCLLALPINHEVDDTLTIDVQPFISVDWITIAHCGLFKHDEKTFEMNCIDSVLDYAIYKVEVVKNIEPRNIEKKEFANKNVLLTLPTINISQNAHTNNLLTVKKIMVNKRIFDRCVNYSLANNATLSKMMSYVRSLLSTYDTSRTGIFPTYHSLIESAQSTAIAALCMTKLDRNGMIQLSDLMIEMPELTNLTLKLFETVNKNDVAMDVIQGALSRLSSRLGINLRKLAELMVEVRVNIKPTGINLKFCKPWENTDTVIEQLANDNSVESTETIENESTDTPDQVEDDSWSGNASYDSGDSSNYYSVSTATDSSQSSYHSAVNVIDVDNMVITVKNAEPFDYSETHLQSSDARAPSNLFDSSSISVPLSSIQELWNQPHVNSQERVWIYWQDSTEDKENYIVSRCIESIKNTINLQLVVLDSRNEQTYLPDVLMEFKPLVTIQAWSDIVRMWVLYKYGGIWSDASVFMDCDAVDMSRWLTHSQKQGFMFYQRQEGELLTMDNWFIVVQPGLPVIATWAKTFMTIIYHGNDAEDAMTDLMELHGFIPQHYNKYENYLTMHEASKFINNKQWRDHFTLMPGFAGPLAWITPNMDISAQVRRLTDENYRGIMGITKLINLSRKLLIECAQTTLTQMFDNLSQPKLNKQALVIGVGTRGDHITFTELSNRLTNMGVSNKLILVGEKIYNKDAVNLKIDQDPLSVANPTNIDSLTNSLHYISNLLDIVYKELDGEFYNYMYCNFHVPGMMAVSRTIGGTPIHVGGPPLHNKLSDSSYFTSSGKWELAIDSIVNSLLQTKFQTHNTFAFTGLINGLKTLPHWWNTSSDLVQSNCFNVAAKCVGSLITGDIFDCSQGQLTVASLTSKTDLLMLGPSISNVMVQEALSKLAENDRASSIIVVGSNLMNLCYSKSSRTNRSLKRMYSRLAFVPTLDIMTLNGKLNLAITHGGCNTTDDLLKLGCKHISVGKVYDQQYWKSRDNAINKVTIETAIVDVHCLEESDYKMSTAYELAMSNLLPVKYIKSIEKCDYTVLFNPQQPDGCVRDCYLKYIEFKDREEVDCGMGFKPLMDQQELLIAYSLRQLNVRIISNNGTAESFKLNDSWDYINVMLMPQRNIMHCVLVSVRNVLVTREFVSDKVQHDKVVEQWHSRLTSNNEENSYWTEFLKSGLAIDKYYRRDLIRSKFCYTTNTKNWMQRSKRVMTPCAVTTCNKIGPNTISVPVTLVVGKLYMAVYCNICQYAVCCNTGTYSVLHLADSNMNGNIMLIDLGCKLLHLQSNLRDINKRFEDVTYKPLNQTTSNTLQRITVTVPCAKSVCKMGDNVIITDYDNRMHDKYNEKLMIDNASAIHWVANASEEELITRLNKTYNKGLRNVLHGGKIKTEIATHTNSSCFLTSALAKHYRLHYATGTSIRIDGLLPDDTEQLLFDKYDWMSRTNGQKDFVMVHKKNKQEWLDFLNIDSGDWEVIVEFMVVENDIFMAEVTTKGNVVANRLTWNTLTQRQFEVVDKKSIFSYELAMFIRPPKRGGEVFNNTEKISLGNSRDWWKPIGNEEVILKDIEPDSRMQGLLQTNDIGTTANSWMTTVTYENLVIEEDYNDVDVVLDLQMENCADMVDHTIVPFDIQNLWTNTDLTMDLRQYAPVNKGVIRSKENPDAIVETTKFTLNNVHPMESRPVLTKWVFEEHRSISGRLFSKLKLRRKNPNVSATSQCRKLMQTYFSVNFVPFTQTEQILDVDEFETALWISKRKDGVKIQQELNELFTTELGVIPLNAINIHLKLESLLKEKPIMHWGQHQARAIYWQRKAIAAISSPVFLKAKTRLKESLKAKFIYADGMTPLQLTYKCRQTSNVSWFFENDLSKQDRQTDKPTLDVEMKLYAQLGVSCGMLKWWKTMHETWRFRARWNKGYAQEMRLTGQSTTSLGNLITNMQVHCEFFKRNLFMTKLVLFLGDDMLALLEKKPDVSWLAEHSKREHNMTSKPYLSQDCGLFCCMIAFRNTIGSCDLGPDYTRLKFRFEVTNGASQATAENIEARCQSYACMLGDTKEMQQLKHRRGWGIPLVNWYDQSSVVQAVCNRYELNEAIVKGHYGELCNYLDDPQPNAVVFNHYRACKKY